jgi:hypothetical protein
MVCWFVLLDLVTVGRPGNKDAYPAPTTELSQWGTTGTLGIFAGSEAVRQSILGLIWINRGNLKTLTFAPRSHLQHLCPRLSAGTWNPGKSEMWLFVHPRWGFQQARHRGARPVPPAEGQRARRRSLERSHTGQRRWGTARIGPGSPAEMPPS